MNEKLPATHEHIVATEFEGGEGVLVDLNAKRYYKLNETAMLVWRALERGDTLQGIVDEMTAIYDVSREHAAASIRKILLDLQSSQLVHRS